MHRLPRILIVLVALLSAPLAAAEEGQKGPAPSHAFIDMEGSVDRVGDMAFRMSLRPPPERWKLLKTRYNTPQMLFRDVMAHRGSMETEFPEDVVFDERNLRIHTRMNLLGYARNLGDGAWSVDLELTPDQRITGFEQADRDGQAELRWRILQTSPELVLEMNIALRIPKGATDLAVDQQRGRFTYTLPQAGGTGRPRLEAAMRVKPRILTGAYKVYAMADAAPDQWLAKAVLRNTGQAVLKRLRVRFRVPGYAEWGLWTKFPEVVPGQTVVVPYYPALDAKVAQLQSKTPINIMVEWRYEDADGKPHEDSDGVRATMMGGHEYYFTNYQYGERDDTNWYEVMTENKDLLAAWVSREDPVVDEFAAMANRLAGGSPSSTSPDAALASLHAIYELWVRNKFVYVSPPGVIDKSVSFDPKLVQNIKYPRDVIRDKAGTCIDLAILYAAMASSLGLDAYLALVPGHCFPVFRLPLKKGEKERRWWPIEATGIMGGLGPRVHSWPEVCKVGQVQLERVFAGKMPGALVDVRALWELGVTGPELPTLPADIMKRWGIDVGSGPILTAGNGAGQDGQGSQGGGAAAQLIGTWEGAQLYHLPQGQLRGPLRLVIQADRQGALVFQAVTQLDVPMDGGGSVRLVSQGEGRVLIENGQVVLHQLKGQTKNMQTGEISQESPLKVPVQVQGTSMTGRIRTDEGYDVSVALKKQ